jgi:SAM-dependent methyltransferase
MTGLSRKANRVSVVRREIQRKYNELGVAGTLRAGGTRLFRSIVRFILLKKEKPHPFDERYGTDTGGVIEPGALDITDTQVAHAHRYQTAIIDVFLDILGSLLISYEKFLFVDLGSGKGRALLLASRFPFKRIIGVELSEKLHKIARRNIEIYRDEQQKCHELESVCEDVTNYRIPDGNLVFYLFNPFDVHVLNSVLSNIEKSRLRYPGEIRIAYLKPVHRHVLDQSPFLEVLKQTERYVIYRNKDNVSR